MKPDIESVSKEFWALNEDTYSRIYRTYEWLVDSQRRLGDFPAYAQVYDERQTPIALLPAVIFANRSTYSPVDPHRMVEEAYHEIYREPIAMVTTLFGLGNAILVKDHRLDWNAIIPELQDELTKNYSCKCLVFSYHSEVDDPFLSQNFSIAFKRLPHKPFGLFHAKQFSSFESYLRTLSTNARISFRRESRRLAQNGVTIKTLPLCDCDLGLIGQLASNVFKKYGITVDPARLTTFARHVSDSFREDSGMFSAWKGETLLSYTLYIRHHDALHLKMLGRNYELDRYSSYFAVAYYEPIRFSIERRLSLVDYGSGSPGTKVRKGIRLYESYSYLFRDRVGQ